MAGSTDVVVRFLADVSDISDGVKKIEGTTGKLKSWAKGIGTAIAGAFAVDKIRDFVNAGAELQDQLAATDVIFGKSAKNIVAMSKKTTDELGISQTAALDAANTFAAFGKSAGLTGDDLAGFSGSLVGLAGDLASFRGTSTEQAIEAIGSALRGESEPIRAYGVLLDEATLKARALSMGLLAPVQDQDKIKAALLTVSNAQAALNKAIEKYGPNSKEATEAQQKLEIAQSKLGKATEGTVPDLTAQQKVLAAQAEIFAQTGDAQGDFARTSDSAANQQKKLKAAMDDASAAIGTALLPLVSALAPVLQAVAGFVQQNTNVILPFVAVLGAWVAVQWLLNAAMTAFGISSTLAVGWIALLVVAVAAAYTAVALLYAKWDEVWAWIGNLPWYAKVALLIFAITNPVTLLIGVVTALAVYWNEIWAAITAVVGRAYDVISTILGAVAAVFSTVFGWIATIVDTWVGRIQALISNLVGWLSIVFGPVAQILSGPFNIARTIIVAHLDAILMVVRGMQSAIAAAVRFIGDVLAAPFQAAWTVIDRIVGWLLDRIDDLTGPFEKIGGFLGKIGGVAGGIIGLQHGGIVTKPTLAMIGEAGPEAVIPLGHGAGGGGPYTINVNVTTTGLGADAPSIQSAVVAALRHYTTRNGPLPATIVGG